MGQVDPTEPGESALDRRIVEYIVTSHTNLHYVVLGILRPFGTAEDAEDALQQFTRSRLLALTESYDPEQDLGKYIRSCVMNFARSYKDRLRSRVSKDTAYAVRHNHGSDDHAKQIELKILVEEGLKTLQPVDRRILELHYMLGYTDEEISSDIGLKINAVRVRRFRAIRLLRKTYIEVKRYV